MWAKTNKILEDTTFIFGDGFGFDLETRGCYGTTVVHVPLVESIRVHQKLHVAVGDPKSSWDAHFWNFGMGNKLFYQTFSGVTGLTALCFPRKVSIN